ncbi:cysteine peptidase family C39 domain-containing protein, partial [Clostridium oceanicum]|uniref:cysteine peptidase family C39 domain-containing protein n=1 Tax=Clostridium oceanicum TaxID=1543 RepID=UPI0031CE6392
MEKNIRESLTNFIFIARINHVPLTEDQLDHDFALEGKDVGEKDILLISKKVGLKAKAVEFQYDELKDISSACLIETKDKKYTIVTAVNEEKVLYFDLEHQKISEISKENFLSMWSGKIILIKN